MENVIVYSENEMNEAFKILEGVRNNDGRTNIVCLGQTEQSKGIRFVLYTYVEDQYQYGNPMQFRAILSNDLIDACERARVLCGNSNIELHSDVNNEQTSIKMQVESFYKNNPDMVFMLETKNYIVEDIKNYLNRKGRISRSQIGLVEKIYEQHQVWAEENRIKKENESKFAHLEVLYFNEKERVELSIAEVLSTVKFDTEWGFKSIIKYLTECGKVVVYSGTSPKEIGAGSKIKATIKHNVYNGITQTLLQRISVL